MLYKVVSLRPSIDSGVFQYLPDPTLLMKAAASSIEVPSSSDPREIYYYKDNKDKKDNDKKVLDKIEFDSTCSVKRNRYFFIFYIFLFSL